MGRSLIAGRRVNQCDEGTDRGVDRSLIAHGMWGRRSRLRTLPAAVRGKSSSTTSRAGSLWAASPASAANVRRASSVSGSVGDTRAQADERAHGLAERVVGRRAHRHLVDEGVLGQHVLDFAGRDVLAATDDDVLHAIGDREEPVGVEAALVAGAEPRAVDERLDIERGVAVADELPGPARQDLALLAGSDVDQVLVDDPHLVARSDPAVGEPPLVGRVVGRSAGDRRVFGRSVRAPRDDARCLGASDEGRRDRGRADEESRQRRDVAARTLGLVEQRGEVERRTRARRDSVLLDDPRRPPRTPAVHHDGRTAARQRSQEPEHRRDVAGRERRECPHRRVVRRAESRQQRLVGVLHAFRQAGRPRRVEHAGHRRCVA